jgi:hypothetical protein
MSEGSKGGDEPPERGTDFVIHKENNDCKPSIDEVNEFSPFQQPKNEEYLNLQDELMPSQDPNIEKPLNPQEEEDVPVVLHTASLQRKNGKHAPFFISLVINELILHNYML